MQQWDIVTLENGTYALILQADLLDHAAYRVAAPLVPAKTFKSVPKLHLPVRIARKDYVVVVDKMAAIHTKAIRIVVSSMKEREWDIRRALDLVFVGV
jgi:choline dehydrogenase-like flavoprotein